MIINIRHRGLKLLFEKGDHSRLRADIAGKAERFLDALNVAATPEEVDLPGYGLHMLKGDMKGFWSAVVSRNHQIIFRFEEGNAYDLDLVDYH